MWMMDALKYLLAFMDRVSEDPEISAYHVSLYLALVYYGQHVAGKSSFRVFSREVRPYAKVSRPGTYHQLLSDLARRGYIEYSPSHSPVIGSLVSLVSLGL
jgi:hypothetical protein